MTSVPHCPASITSGAPCQRSPGPFLYGHHVSLGREGSTGPGQGVSCGGAQGSLALSRLQFTGMSLSQSLQETRGRKTDAETGSWEAGGL